MAKLSVGKGKLSMADVEKQVGRKRKKVLIVTWYDKGYNYGQTLQAYAMQKALHMLGVDAETLTFHSDIRDDNTWKTFITHQLQDPKASLWKKLSFEAFIHTHMHVTKPCNNAEELKRLVQYEAYDCLICGSDQIWNPLAYSELLLLGIDTKIPKIGYACSTLGVIDEEKYAYGFERMEPWWNQFQSISMRERSGRDIVSKYCDVPVTTNIDPTLLLSPKIWNSFKHQSIMHKKPYIFCYFLGEYRNYQEYIEYMKKKYQVNQVIMIHSSIVEANRDYNNVEHAGPVEWLNLIGNATAVLTDSFHGVIFSVVYQKEFYIVSRKVPIVEWHPRKGHYPYSNPDRISGLLSMLELEGRKVESIADIESCGEIHWNRVKKNWKKARRKSLMWLKQQLDCQ